MKQKIKVMLWPTKHSEHNGYIDNLYRTICNEYEVVGYDEMKKKGIKDILSADIYHLNWYENISSSNSKAKSKLMIIKKKVCIYVLKVLRKKIIWTVHNSVPHDLDDSKSIIGLMKFISRKADKIHIMCTDTLNNKYFNLKKYEKKIVLIPLGDYINNYGYSNVDIKDRYGIKKDEKIILFSGLVRKYKNIELLVEAFEKSGIEKSKFILLICGLCQNVSYKEELQKNIETRNVKFDFEFIKDDEMGDYLQQSDILVSPYNKESSLNSATLIMAMSYSKSFICPLIGTVKEIKDYNKMLYVYDYSDKREHLINLIKQFQKIEQDVKENEKILQEKGKLAYEYIQNNQTWEGNKQSWLKLYKF